MVFKETLARIREQAKKDIGGLTSQNLDAVKTRYLGRKSELNELLSRLKDLPEGQRVEIGKLGNIVKKEITEAFKKAESELVVSSLPAGFDPTIPGIRLPLGRLHPITQLTRELVELFSGLGFSVAEGPEIESEEYNFNLLNIPPDHPARDEWDTFWIRRKEGAKDNLLLRPHTSPVQLRYMQDHPVPIRVIAPGRTFRFEAEDATHGSVFNQLEGLMVDRNISVGHLKATLEIIFAKLLGSDISLRLRPSFFPFTEPSFEVDVWFRGEWLELGGAGMVHPQVLRNANIDPDVYSGFAFGLGIDRLAMLKHNIKDVRLLLSSNINFLNQF